MSANRAPSKPLLLLDVDGVVNDIGAVMKVRPLGDAAEERARKLGVDLIRSHGFWLAIPHHMPQLIQELSARSETWWCSTWCDRANDELAAHLGVGPFPVVDDCRRQHGAAWKTDAARPLIEEAVAEGRSVVWIASFNGSRPQIAGVTYIDTSANLVLRPTDIPDGAFRPAA